MYDEFYCNYNNNTIINLVGDICIQDVSDMYKTDEKLANETGMTINVCHFPPGTSKWNKIEHKMFCYISQNWRGKPLRTRETVVNLIGGTRTKKGLTIKAILDEKIYEKGKKISNEELNEVKLEKYHFHGEWNYKIKPQN